jgi:hypothetical protein
LAAVSKLSFLVFYIHWTFSSLYLIVCQIYESLR